jgi:hypothetical protein
VEQYIFPIILLVLGVIALSAREAPSQPPSGDGKQAEPEPVKIKTGWLDLPLPVPVLPHQARIVSLWIGGLLVLAGIIVAGYIAFSPAEPVVEQAAFESTVISATYEESGWDPHVIDIRSATEDGIPVWPRDLLEILDVWFTTPTEPGEYQVQVKVLASGDGEEEWIGETPILDLQPGKMRVESFSLLKHAKDDRHWEIQDNWKYLDIVIFLLKNKVEINQSSSRIRLNPDGTAFLRPYIEAKFVDLVVQINDEPETTLNIRERLTEEWPLRSDDRLCIQQVWYRSKTGSETTNLGIEADLLATERLEGNYRNSMDNPFEPGINQVEGFKPFCWQIQPMVNLLSISLYSSDGPVLDQLVFPIKVITGNP